jgi:hypothetical protein
MQPKGFLTKLGMAPGRVSVVTTASPRFGDATFTKAFNRMGFARIDRLVNNRDIVPLLPPEQIGFTHIGNEILLNQTTNSVTNCNPKFKSSRDGSCSSFSKFPVIASEPSKLIESHNVYLGVQLGDLGCVAPTPTASPTPQPTEEEEDDDLQTKSVATFPAFEKGPTFIS